MEHMSCRCLKESQRTHLKKRRLPELPASNLFASDPLMCAPQGLSVDLNPIWRDSHGPYAGCHEVSFAGASTELMAGSHSWSGGVQEPAGPVAGALEE